MMSKVGFLVHHSAVITGNVVRGGSNHLASGLSDAASGVRRSIVDESDLLVKAGAWNNLASHEGSSFLVRGAGLGQGLSSPLAIARQIGPDTVRSPHHPTQPLVSGLLFPGVSGQGPGGEWWKGVNARIEEALRKWLIPDTPGLTHYPWNYEIAWSVPDRSGNFRMDTFGTPWRWQFLNDPPAPFLVVSAQLTADGQHVTLPFATSTNPRKFEFYTASMAELGQLAAAYSPFGRANEDLGSGVFLTINGAAEPLKGGPSLARQFADGFLPGNPRSVIYATEGTNRFDLNQFNSGLSGSGLLTSGRVVEFD